MSETVTKSKFEYALHVVEDRNIKKLKLPPQLSDAGRKHIQVFTCQKCGKIKRFVDEI
jgi:hypothetical protein